MPDLGLLLSFLMNANLKPKSSFQETLTLSFSSDHFLASESSHCTLPPLPRKVASSMGSESHLDISLSPPKREMSTSLEFQMTLTPFLIWWIGLVREHISILDSKP